MAANGEELDVSGVSDDSPLVRLLETKGRVKMLDAMLRHSYAELTEEEIAEYSGTDQSTINRNLPVLTDLGLVTRVDEWPARYQLVEDNPVVEGLESVQLHLMGTSDRMKESDVPRRSTDHNWATPSPNEDEIRRVLRDNPHLVHELYHEIAGTESRRRPPTRPTSLAA